MELFVAKTAGFCFGVARALDMVYDCAGDTENQYYTLGPIIHNAQAVEELKQKGIAPVDSIADAQPGSSLIVRTHGVGKDAYDEMEARGIRYVDVTCPFVKKIHNIVKQYHDEGYQIVIIGDARHPEVQGINGWCGNSATIIADPEQAERFVPTSEKVCIVCQTTFHKNICKKIIFFLKKTCQDALIFDTICNATRERQEEAQKLAQTVDVMIVLGGKNSSNTQKLYEICRAVCETTYCLETIDELPHPEALIHKRVGMTAGASTPAVIIKEAINIMENLENKETVAETQEAAVENLEAAAETTEPVAEVQEAQEQSFAAMFEDSLKTLNTGDVVKGTVIEVRPTEVIVDLQVKQDGIIPAAEISDDPNVAPADVVKPGDVIDVFVVRVNDADGNIMLSKRKLDSIQTWDDVVKAHEDGAVLEGKVTAIVKGGMIAMYKGVKVFIPASLASDRFLSDLSVLSGQNVAFKVIDINEKRRRVVGSVKAVLAEQKAALEKVFWEGAAVGNRYTGVVKSLTNFGAFVDIGGVDGLVHISELSWSRIKHPSEVVSVGDSIDVYIKDINEETKKISLGFKKAEENPWVIAHEKLNEGDVIKVKIVRMMPFGAFAEIIPGIDGLIHISQIANKRIAKPQDELEIGQEVDAQITEIDWVNKKIGLSIRALLPEEAPVEEPAAEEAKEEEADTVHKEELGATIGEALDIKIEEPAVEEAVEEAKEETAEAPSEE